MKSNAMEVEIDRISELPDDIVVKIISCLRLKEAVATSSISTRWRDLWMLYSGCFDFDGSDTVYMLNQQYRSSGKKPSARIIATKRKIFVDCVNHVLRSHRGATIERLRIAFDLRNRSHKKIDNWVQLALVKRAQCIHLDLTSFEDPLCPSIEYDFPVHCHCGFQFLKTLILKHVRISGEALESIVDNCPNLEGLKVTCSESLKVFKLSSLSLKYLNLWACGEYNIYIMDVNIYAPNLLSFTWSGGADSNLVLEDVSQLNHVNLYGYRYHIHSHHSQLVKLDLDDRFSRDPANQGNIIIPKLSNLKHLKMRYTFIEDQTFCLIVAYLNAAPLLENFTLEMLPPYRRPKSDAKLTDAVLNLTENHCYKNLKTVKFIGFGLTNDVEFITHLLNHVPLLEKIVLDACDPNFLGTPLENEHRLAETYLEARDRALNISVSLDCHVTVV